MVSWDIFRSQAVFWRARWASQNTRDEKHVVSFQVLSILACVACVKRGRIRGNWGARERVVSRAYSLPLPFRTPVTQATPPPSDVPRGSSRVPAPLTSADLSGKKSERSHERWRPYSFRTNNSVNSRAFVLEATLTISLKKKITSEVKIAERKSALPQNDKVWKKFCLLFDYKFKYPPGGTYTGMCRPTGSWFCSLRSKRFCAV